jgi:hypothetical protein
MPFRIRTTVWAFVLIVTCIGLGVVSGAHAAGVLGGRLGVAVSTLDTEADDVFDAENHEGFALSGFYQIGTGNFTFQPELSYIEKGVQDGMTGQDITLSYAEIAALAKLGLPILGMQPHVFAGLAGDIEVNKDSPFDIDTKSFTPNVLVGADLMLTVGPVYLIGDGRYAVGLSDINEVDDVVSDLKNRSWIFSLGVGLKM